MTIKNVTLGIAAALVVAAGADRLVADDAVEAKLPTLRIVFFTPRDVSPPRNVDERLTQVARYTEDFFVKWMTHWKYEPARKQMFQWKPDGRVEVLYAQGEQRADQIKDGSFRPQVVKGLVEKHRIPQNSNIWWFFVYLGDPPTRFANFRGAGDSKLGGWAILNYDSSPGEVRLDKELAEGFHHDFMLKGAVHELGHGLGLPHIGPRLKLDLGNSLMGPVTRNWIKYMGPKDRRGHLSEASAAMLWKHPIFSGTAKDRRAMPNVNLRSYQARYDSGRKQIEIRGQLTSNRKAHSVIVADDMDEKPGEYWIRAYVGRVEKDGGFQVVIDEPVKSGGTYRIVFCFDNGIVSGDGKKVGLASALEKPYRYVRQSYRFE